MLLLLNHLLDPLERPIDLLARDRQRRSDANHVIMRLLAEDAEFLERFAVRTRLARQLNADPQTDAANFFQFGTAQRFELLEEVSPVLG